MITDQELLEKYPLAFIHYDGKPGTYFECGPGWNDIMEPCFKYMHEYNQKQKPEDYLLPIQIKEKFGTLRFYTNWSNDELDVLVDKAEKASETTCEVCGQPGAVRPGGWVVTRCDLHFESKK